MKNTVLTILLVVVAAWIAWKSTPPTVDSMVKVVFHQNKTPIREIRQERDISESRTLHLDKIDFDDGQFLEHDWLGKMPFDYNYFADFEAQMEVEKAGRYHFNVSSDDGFVLMIDGKELCAFEGDRPMALDQCEAELGVGKHRFELQYFQGGGNCGLKVMYREDSKRRYVYIGEDSEALRFTPY